MPRQSPYLHLLLPRGSKYWNYETWNHNMEILDDAFAELGEFVHRQRNASEISFDNTFSPSIQANNVQDAILEILAKSNSITEIYVSKPVTISVPTQGHSYIVLEFGDETPEVSFVKSDYHYPEEIQWINGLPAFRPNRVYELSFLQLACVWIERDPQFAEFFEYYIENGTIYVTKIKTNKWYSYYENYDIVIPSHAYGYPVMLDDDVKGV